MKDIQHIHDIKNATVVRVALRGGVPTAVGPGGEVLEASELEAEVVRDIRPGELGGYLPRQPVPDGCNFAIARPRMRKRVCMENNALVQE